MLKGLLIGLGVGGLLGLIADGFWAAIGVGFVFGFVGWLIGLIVTVANKSSSASTAARSPAPAATHSVRIAALEARVAALEARLADGWDSTGQAPAETGLGDSPLSEPVVPARPAEAETQPLDSRGPAPAASVPDQGQIRVRSGSDPDLTPTIPLPPREPPKPNPVVAWFTGGNAIARIGVVVLFIGLAFLLRYSIEHGLVPPELRVAGIGFTGLVLLVIGWRLRTSKPGYALSLQGAGVGILYLTVFGALRLYNLIPPEAAFPLLVIIAALATVLAVKQDSAVLAGFGAAGGFIAPVLASTGRGDHVMLFGYFTVLNLAILATAVFKRWRSLNLIGFAFTFVIGLAWGARYYRPEHFASVEPFLVIFFLMYVAVAVLFARHAAPTTGDRVVDGTLVFGVPLVGFGLQSAMLHDTEFGLAISALILAAFYLALSALVSRKGGERTRLLAQAFLALGVVFITVTIPLAFDARWTSAAWAVEGAAVLWIGVRQGRWVPQAFGTLVQLAGGFTFLMAQPGIAREMLFLNGSFLGFAMLAVAGLFSHNALRLADPAPKLAWLRPVYFVWAMAWWFAGVAEDLFTFMPDGPALNGFIAIAAATVLALARLHRDGHWPEAAWPSAAWVPAMYALFALSLVEMQHPFAYLGWVAWPFAFAAHLVARRSIEGAAPPSSRYVALLHAGGLVLAALIGGIELRWFAIEAGLAHTAWSAAAWVVVPCVFLIAVSSRGLEHRWPIAAHPRAYRAQGGLVLAVAAFLWILGVNAAKPGPSTPLPYLPLLNGIDLAHGLVAIAFVSWWRALTRAGERPQWLDGRAGAALMGVAAFAWANGILLRSLHHWAGVPYDIDAWMRSFVTQASLSIFWSLLALGLMVWATRKAKRVVWMVGAVLMAVVVAKLALVDFARLGGLERIVSFIGVGILMLVIGYFSPVPPRHKEAA
jgi:uncharacterized membrane protein